MTWHIAIHPFRTAAPTGRGQHRPIALALWLTMLAAGCSPVADLTPAPASPAAQTAPSEAGAGVVAPYPAPGSILGAPAPGTNAEGTPVDPAAWVRAQVSPAESVLIDDWKAANDSGQPESLVKENLAVSGNALRIEPSTLQRAQQPWSIDLAYGISAAAPNDYVGFDRDLPQQQNWSGADHVLIDVDASRAPGVALVFQFWEASGEVWRHTASLSSLVPGEPLRVPLDSQHFERAGWSARVNDVIDLDAIDTFGVYVGHTGPGRAGNLTLGALAAYRGAPPTP
jgi:hypothetical protein